MTPDGMRVVRLLAQDQIAVNVSLCFSAAQALIVGKAGAAYVSPFVGRLDDIGAIGMDVIEQIIRIYDNYGFQTLVLVESVRNPVHVLDAALMGADVATLSFPIIDQLFRHPLTEIARLVAIQSWLPRTRRVSGRRACISRRSEKLLAPGSSFESRRRNAHRAARDRGRRLRTIETKSGQAQKRRETHELISHARDLDDALRKHGA
jgi:hypothetical protein